MPQHERNRRVPPSDASPPSRRCISQSAAKSLRAPPPTESAQIKSVLAISSRNFPSNGFHHRLLEQSVGVTFRIALDLLICSSNSPSGCGVMNISL